MHPRALARHNGDIHYFTGKPCKNGHVDYRFTKNAVCVVCNTVYAAEFYQKNPEKVAQSNKKWRAENPEKYKELSRTSKREYRKNKKNEH